MTETNRIKPSDEVKLTVYQNGRAVDSFEGTGFKELDELVTEVFENSNLDDRNREDYVFKVTNISTGTSARYRVNAGGHLKLIPELN